MNKEAIAKNPVVKLSFEFSLDIITYCELLEANRKHVIATQLLKSGTSVGANIVEPKNAESQADFIHKFKIAAKEVEDAEYWLMLCSYSDSYPACDALLEKISILNKMIEKIISTTKRKRIITNEE